jgi:hypothetical protein
MPAMEGYSWMCSAPGTETEVYDGRRGSWLHAWRLGTGGGLRSWLWAGDQQRCVDGLPEREGGAQFQKLLELSVCLASIYTNYHRS